MKEEDRSNYVDHILWHEMRMHQQMIARIDPIHELDLIKAHLSLEDRNAIEKTLAEPLTKSEILDQKMEQLDLERVNDAVDEDEIIRRQHDFECHRFIRAMMKQFDARHILMSEEWYKVIENPRPISPEEKKKYDAWVDSICNVKPLSQEEIDKRLNL